MSKGVSDGLANSKLVDVVSTTGISKVGTFLIVSFILCLIFQGKRFIDIDALIDILATNIWKSKESYEIKYGDSIQTSVKLFAIEFFVIESICTHFIDLLIFNSTYFSYFFIANYTFYISFVTEVICLPISLNLLIFHQPSTFTTKTL